MGTGDFNRACLTQVVRGLFVGKTGGSETVEQSLPEQSWDVHPLERRYIIADKGIPAVAVDRQKGLVPPQVNDMKIPAKTPIRLSAILRRFNLQKSLERKSKTQFHHFTSLGMVIFVT